VLAGVHVVATRRIRFNREYAAAMSPFCQIALTTRLPSFGVEISQMGVADGDLWKGGNASLTILYSSSFETTNITDILGFILYRSLLQLSIFARIYAATELDSKLLNLI